MKDDMDILIAMAILLQLGVWWRATRAIQALDRLWRSIDRKLDILLDSELEVRLEEYEED